jgi:hypothetical protein
VDLYTQILRPKVTTAYSDSQSNANEPTIPLILAENKVDLTVQRKVSYHRGEGLSRDWNFVTEVL